MMFIRNISRYKIEFFLVLFFMGFCFMNSVNIYYIDNYFFEDFYIFYNFVFGLDIIIYFSNSDCFIYFLIFYLYLLIFYFNFSGINSSNIKIIGGYIILFYWF